MTPDDDACYRAVQARDARFDGWFVSAVTSTGIYCRPSCPARTPMRANVRFFSTAAAAQAAGFRACRRCRPDATPGSPEWRARADLVGRAMRLIADGVVDRAGVAGLAAQLGYSERHLNRQLVAELGVGPTALARAQRAHTARILLETTDLPVADTAFAAGFASVRQFNDTIRAVFAATPTELRRARHNAQSSTPGTVVVRLPYREPMDLRGIVGFLAARAVPGVEESVEDSATYRRSLRLAHGDGVLALTPGSGHVRCAVQLTDLRDLTTAVHRCRRLLDLDADPVAVDQALAADPLLGPSVHRRPGQRVPGHVDGAELAVRAVIGQQVSVAGACTVAGNLVARWGKPVNSPVGTVTHLFPTAETLAAIDPAELPMPRARARTLVTLALAIAEGRVDLEPGADRDEVEQQLLALPGVGPWTASYIAMRALGDPDVFLPTDLGVRRAIKRLGQPGDPKAVAALAERWRPWRSYALQHLWSTL
jgi:AraC family transcriptional regulator of adaptative response / DNA-3-methyladenine glycosylase II